ncbi:MAG TPA: hypothetical protein PKN32_02080 [Bacteroidales bacterium]|nr:hypothetical protein [Bacteroidales bacterium]
MKKLVYNTLHGQLTINSNDSVILEFQNLYMQLNLEQFYEFVSFVNQNIKQLAGSIAEKPKDSFYHIVLRNMNIEMVEEFQKLINVPVFSPDGKYDVFDYLKQMKNKQTGIFTDKVSSENVKLDTEAICLN